MGARPSGTVTFLFTDIEGSTGMWERHPDQMRDAVRRHDELVRAAVERRSGYVFTTAGDSFASAFASAADATAAAVEVQRACSEEPWPEPVSIVVRCGLHTGVADERDGDYFGQAPNRAARIMAAANAGPIVCSAATARLLDGAETMVELGRFRLRDLGEPVELWQLASPVREVFGPLATLDHTAGNLPVQLTELFGRDDLVRSLAEAVAAHRLVTLTGVGGVGKTRLGLQVAAEIGHRFSDGAWLVELAPVRKADKVAGAVLEGLRITPRPGMTDLESAVDRLRSAEALIVLDNCEHVLTPAGQVAAGLLQSCPGVRLLATSREGLGVGGEHIHAVPSLEVPDPGSEAVSAPSVQLFVDRAVALGGWQPDEGDWPWIAELSRRLDGIPLAIELAAGRANVLSIEDIVGRLDDRFRLLTGQRGASLRRHETLRAAVEWSYELLDDDERDLFDRLGVFVGAFDLAAATAAAALTPDDSLEVIDGLSALINRSVVQVDRSTHAQRYRLLETLRQFAADRLVESGLSDEVRRLHAHHFASEAERIAQRLTTADEYQARDELDSVLPDLRAGIAWALDNGASSVLATSIGPFHATPAIVLRSVTGLATEEVVHEGERDPTWGLALPTMAAYDAYLRGDPELAAARRLQLARTQECDDPSLAIGAWNAHASLSAILADADGARAGMSRALELAQQADDSFKVAWATLALDVWMTGLGQPGPPLADSEMALSEAQRIGNPFLLALGLFSLAYRLELTDPDRALQLVSQLNEIPTHRLDGVNTLLHSVIGRVLLRRNEHRRALANLETHLRAAHRDGMRVEFAYSARAAAGCLAPLGYGHEAGVIFEAFPAAFWNNQREAEELVDTSLSSLLDPEERASCIHEAAQLGWTDATDYTLEAVSNALGASG